MNLIIITTHLITFINKTAMPINLSSPSSTKSSSTRGKLYRGPTVTAYSRCTVPTIPSAVENILFRKPNNLSPIKSNLFAVQKNSVSLSFKNGMIDKQLGETPSDSSETISLFKQKPHDLKASERFNYNDIQKYYPGPGDYNPKLLEKSLRYNSLFESSLCQPESWGVSPGPGTYNVSSDLNANVYISPFSRFQKKRVEEYKKIVGPGSYNVSIDLVNKERDKISPMFMNEIPKKNDSEAIMKYLDSHENILSNKRKQKQEKASVKVKNFNDLKEEILQMNLKYSNEESSQKKNTESERMPIQDYESKEIINLKRLKGPYINPISKSDIPVKKHDPVPGPCYYDQPVPRRKIFNANMNNNWLGRC